MRTIELQMTNRRRRDRLVAVLISLVLFAQTLTRVYACGPETIEPIFVFTDSPDLPFAEFAKGRIGILRSTFGRKTLVIAHRYLLGATFTEDEQRGLVEALKGKAPEDNDDSAIKAWIAARKEILPDEQTPPTIYDERHREGYDFFPNCTKNAFEVATQTLSDRVASYGAADPNVREWLQGQDVVFRNCAEGAEAPAPVSSGPVWLQKDRDYQIAASYFYTLNFNEAHLRFEKIADDSDSVWQETAGYLVARTLVREASLTDNKSTKQALYERAEAYLPNLMARGGRFLNAEKRLLGLVKFRLRPEERVHELAHVLEEQGGNENLRQDLIDYVWLLDKFDEEAQKTEEERKVKLNPTPTPESTYTPDPQYEARYEAIQRGELIDLYFTPRQPDGQPDYTTAFTVDLKPDATEQDAVQEVEIKLGRKLSSEETTDLKERYAVAVLHRQWLLGPNRKMNTDGDHQGCDFNCNDLTLSQMPAFLLADDLTDWILTLQSNDPEAYAHSLSKWRLTQSPAWLSVALTKATKSSQGLPGLIGAAEKVAPDSPAFPTVAYHLIRLRLDLNRPAEAQKLLDAIILTQFEFLPKSSQNLFLEQRSKLAGSVEEFLKFAVRKPVAFTAFGSIGRVSDLLRIQKAFWDPEYSTETKEEYEKKTDEEFKEFLRWDELGSFDPETAELFNWHFSLNSLLEASRNSQVPDHLRRSLALTVWTRAVLLRNDAVAQDASADVARLAPEMSPLLTDFVKTETRERRADAALYILLKFPTLTPFVESGLNPFSPAEDEDYYFEMSWWCKPDDIKYNMDGTESAKIVEPPRFFSASELIAAKRERLALSAIGDAKSFLGKRVLDWARRSPGDPRIPEALYIAALATQSYKYGCGGWEEDAETRSRLESLLKEKYSQSAWAAKLEASSR